MQKPINLPHFHPNLISFQILSHSLATSNLLWSHWKFKSDYNPIRLAIVLRKSYFWFGLIALDKNNAENYTEIALKNFQCSIFFCNIDFQSSCDFSVSIELSSFYFGIRLLLIICCISYSLYSTFDMSFDLLFLNRFLLIVNVPRPESGA